MIVGLHDDVENFAIHMFCGLIVVHFFTETFNAGTRSIVRNKALVQKMAMPREMFPVASMLVSAFHVGPQLVILTIACLFARLDARPGRHRRRRRWRSCSSSWCSAPRWRCMFSAANVFFRDFGNIVNILTNFVRFGVPMIYPYTLVEERFGEAAQYYLLNPIADAVLLDPARFWVGTTDDPAATGADQPARPTCSRCGLDHARSSAWSCSAIAQLVFTRLENKIPERL